MKKVLEQEGISEQIILVGHSLGGLHVRCYQHLFPTQVAGMVLLDAAHSRLLELMPKVKANLAQQIRMVRVITVLAWAGLLRFVKSSGDHFLHLTDTGFVAGAIREFYCDIQD